MASYLPKWAEQMENEDKDVNYNGDKYLYLTISLFTSLGKDVIILKTKLFEKNFRIIQGKKKSLFLLGEN